MKKISIILESTELLRNGEPVPTDAAILAEIMKRPEYSVTVDLGEGNGIFTYLTSDISYDYVKINADYST